MRELKFRAWDKNEKKMHTVQSIDFVRQQIFIDPAFCSYSLGHVPLMQFTGLLDKNGKEIYEGDIVTLSNTRFTWQQTGVVSWDAEKACFGPFHHFLNEDERWMDVEYTVEVLGNIYEHPSLLERQP